jgi:hypothetical protein
MVSKCQKTDTILYYHSSEYALGFQPPSRSENRYYDRKKQHCSKKRIKGCITMKQNTWLFASLSSNCFPQYSETCILHLTVHIVTPKLPKEMCYTFLGYMFVLPTQFLNYTSHLSIIWTVIIVLIQYFPECKLRLLCGIF